MPEPPIPATRTPPAASGCVPSLAAAVAVNSAPKRDTSVSTEFVAATRLQQPKALITSVTDDNITKGL
jgi:hypothetical protein